METERSNNSKIRVGKPYKVRQVDNAALAILCPQATEASQSFSEDEAGSEVRRECWDQIWEGSEGRVADKIWT